VQLFLFDNNIPKKSKRSSRNNDDKDDKDDNHDDSDELSCAPESIMSCLATYTSTGITHKSLQCDLFSQLLVCC